MSKFGWSMPPGAWESNLPGEEPEADGFPDNPYGADEEEQFHELEQKSAAAEARAVEMAIPDGSITADTELIRVNGIVFVNATKHEKVVDRAVARARAAEARAGELGGGAARVVQGLYQYCDF